MMQVHATLIVPAPLAGTCRAMASNVPAGSGMWITPLCPAGSEYPATHYISAGMIAVEFAALVELDVKPEDRMGVPMAEAFRIPQEQAKAILDASVITIEKPRPVIESMGLTIANLINVNDASRTALESAPGIGSTKAQAIVSGRPWASVADLSKIGLDVAVLSHWYTT